VKIKILITMALSLSFASGARAQDCDNLLVTRLKQTLDWSRRVGQAGPRTGLPENNASRPWARIDDTQLAVVLSTAGWTKSALEALNVPPGHIVMASDLGLTIWDPKSLEWWQTMNTGWTDEAAAEQIQNIVRSAYHPCDGLDLSLCDMLRHSYQARVQSQAIAANPLIEKMIHGLVPGLSEEGLLFGWSQTSDPVPKIEEPARFLRLLARATLLKRLHIPDFDGNTQFLGGVAPRALLYLATAPLLVPFFPLFMAESGPPLDRFRAGAAVAPEFLLETELGHAGQGVAFGVFLGPSDMEGRMRAFASLVFHPSLAPDRQEAYRSFFNDWLRLRAEQWSQLTGRPQVRVNIRPTERSQLSAVNLEVEGNNEADRLLFLYYAAYHPPAH
jgi:hypothetical protein